MCVTSCEPLARDFASDVSDRSLRISQRVASPRVGARSRVSKKNISVAIPSLHCKKHCCRLSLVKGPTKSAEPLAGGDERDPFNGHDMRTVSQIRHPAKDRLPTRKSKLYERGMRLSMALPPAYSWGCETAARPKAAERSPLLTRPLPTTEA